MSRPSLSASGLDRLSRDVDHVIDEALARERIVGTVVLIALDGKLVYARAAGFADRESCIPVRENTIFRFASVSKSIVSAAALAMIEKHMLHLDDLVTQWLPEFRPKLGGGREPPITIRQLLTHTAGLGYGFTPVDGAYQTARVSSGLDMPGLSMSEAMGRIASVPLLFEPGTAWNYSLATDVLGAVMEAAGDATLPDLVRRFITDALDMTDTDFSICPDLVARLAVPYADGTPRPVRMDELHDMHCQFGLIRFSPCRILDAGSYPSGGAGMAGTAGDLLAFLEAIRTGGAPILGPSSARALTTDALSPHMTTAEPGWTFGLGVGVLRDQELAGTPHEAGTWKWGGGYGNAWFVNPRRRLTVTSFTNTAIEGSDGAYPRDLRDAIYYALTLDA